MISSIAVIARENEPIFIKTFANSDDLKFHFLSHAALDIVEEKVLEQEEANMFDSYLGLLYPTEDYNIYGYITTTQIKFIVIVDAHYDVVETNIKSLMTELHDLYISTICNPFRDVSQDLQENESFLRRIQAAEWWKNFK